MNKLDLESHCNGQAPGSGTQPVEKAIPFFLKVLQIITCMIGTRPEILEVGAGNGWNTKELHRVSKLKWIVTDAQKHEPSYCPINVLKAKDAINNYINKWNTLLMVSPTPNVPWSLDAIKHAMTVKDHFFLIFFGEMGHSDGSPGTDRFLDEPDNGFKRLFMKPYMDITFKPPPGMAEQGNMMYQILMMMGSLGTPNKKFVYLYEFTKKP